MVRFGLNAFFGCWNSIPRRPPRMLFSSDSGASTRFLEPSRMEPETTCIGRGSSWSTDMAVMVFPEPEPPTRATISPGATDRLTPSRTGRDAPLPWTLSSSTTSSGTAALPDEHRDGRRGRAGCPLTDQGDAQGDQEDRESRGDDPPRCPLGEGLGRCQHGPPVRLWRLDTEAQVGQGADA